MKTCHLLCYLFILISFYQPAQAQGTQPGTKLLTISIRNASKYVGKIAKINSLVYRAADDGHTLTVHMDPDHSDKPLMLQLTGKSRKNLLAEMRIRRRLNREIKSPLDTSITVTGKIILNQGRLWYWSAGLQMFTWERIFS